MKDMHEYERNLLTDWNLKMKDDEQSVVQMSDHSDESLVLDIHKCI